MAGTPFVETELQWKRSVLKRLGWLERRPGMAAPIDYGSTFATPVVANTTAASVETATPVTITVPTIVGVTYAITLTTRIQASVADLRAGARIRRGSTTADTLIGEALTMPPVAGVGQTVQYTVYDTAVGTSTTWRVFTVTLGGTGNTSLNASASAPTTLAVRRA